jgi:regulator of protease activity HflC (stomatin/prohibitin superfamily)
VEEAALEARDTVLAEFDALVTPSADSTPAADLLENYQFATSQLAQTTLRSVCDQAELDELLAERERINEKIQTILDTDSEPSGIKAIKVEVKQIDLPQEMHRAIAA